jgi:Tol biopolymer transport system component
MARLPSRRSAALLVLVLLAACGRAGGKGGTGGTSGQGSQAPPAPETTGRVVFVSDSRTNLDLFVLDLSSGQITALTRNPSQDLSPASSPDGSRIAFASSNVEGHLQIAAMNADGSGTKALTRCSLPACTSDGSPAWSADGTKIAFGRLTPSNRFQVWVMGADGSGQRKLFEDHFTGGASTDVVASPTWSPDGKRIAFEKDHKIYVMGPDGADVEALTGSGPASDFAPAWSPDGKRIAFMSNRDGHFKIYATNPDGSGVVKLTGDQPGAPIAEDANPAWSPRGTKILFSRDQGNDRNVWVMSADGSDLQQLTLSRSTEDEPAWLASPR